MALKKTKKETENHSIEVLRAHEFKSGDIGFDLSVNGIKLYGLTYMDSDNHEKVKKSFISFPSRKGSDDKYYNHCWFEVTEDDLAEIEKQIGELI